MFRKSAGATTAASVAMIAMTTSSSISVKPRRSRVECLSGSRIGDSQDLFEGRHTRSRLQETIHGHWLIRGLRHAVTNGIGRTAIRDQLTELVVNDHELEDPDAPGVSGSAALSASAADTVVIH